MNTGTVPNNTSEETELGSNKVKEQQETMKLENKEGMLNETSK